MDIFPLLQQQFGDRIRKDKDISFYFTLRTHTIAEYYLEVETRQDWVDIVKFAHDNTIPLFILGGGSNMAVTKDFIPGITVRNLYQKKEIIAETEETADLLVSSGYSVARLVAETTTAGLEGFEYHMGLPGSVGGAIYMNSKWTKPVTYFGDFLLEAHLLTRDGEEKTVERDYFNFAYDYSILQETKEIVLEAVFRLKKTDPDLLKKRAAESSAYRRSTQPHGVQTAGCFFQNISDEDQKRLDLQTKSAGNLIDKAGLKGKSQGGYMVSDHHANFIVNTGTGKPEDLKFLLNLVKQTVKEKYNIDLKEEVVVV